MIDRVEYLKSDQFDEAEKIGNANRVLQGHDEIVRLVKDRADLTEALDNVMLNSLECIVSDNGSIQNMENFKLYLRRLYKMRKIVEMVKASLRMHSVSGTRFGVPSDSNNNATPSTQLQEHPSSSAVHTSRV